MARKKKKSLKERAQEQRNALQSEREEKHAAVEAAREAEAILKDRMENIRLAARAADLAEDLASEGAWASLQINTNSGPSLSIPASRMGDLAPLATLLNAFAEQYLGE